MRTLARSVNNFEHANTIVYEKLLLVRILYCWIICLLIELVRGFEVAG